MTTITHEEYQNLISSEEEPYETAISMLPKEDRAEFLKAQNRYRTLQKEFMSKLKTLDPSLLKQYLRLEEAATDLFTCRSDSMYLKGVMDDHADLRIKGWSAPLHVSSSLSAKKEDRGCMLRSSLYFHNVKSRLLTVEKHH